MRFRAERSTGPGLGIVASLSAVSPLSTLSLRLNLREQMDMAGVRLLVQGLSDQSNAI